jgi:polyhydroxybutyrate depolymerase
MTRHRQRPPSPYLSILLLGALATAGCRAEEPVFAHSIATGLHRATLVHEGHERSYLLYVPERLAQKPAVVLVLHGSGGTAERIRGFTDRRFERLADRHGFLVIYPQGFEGNWNGCRRRAPSSANRLEIDDPGFVRALLRRLEETHGAGRVGGGVLAFGFSGGGHLAFRLALETPELVDAVVAVGAGLPDPSDSDCKPSGQPVAVSLIDGTDDPINPFDGGEVVLPESLGGALLGRVLSAEASAAIFATTAGHPERPAVTRDPDRDGDPSTGIERRVWNESSPEVALITVRGGGHTIPQTGPSRARFPAFAGSQSHEIDAVLEAWSFFERRRNPRGPYRQGEPS